MKTARKFVQEVITQNEETELGCGIGHRHLLFDLAKASLFFIFAVIFAVLPFEQLFSDPMFEQTMGFARIALIFVLLLLGLGGVWQYIYLKISVWYAFTDRRLIIVKGFLVHDYTSIDYFKITNVHVDEELIEKYIFKTATLIVYVESETQNIFKLNRIQPYTEAQRVIYRHKGGHLAHMSGNPESTINRQLD